MSFPGMGGDLSIRWGELAAGGRLPLVGSASSPLSTPGGACS